MAKRMSPYQHCVELAAQIAVFRDKWCMLCGNPNTPHGHHLWKRSRKIWVVQVDPDFVVRLCGDCHVFAKKSAHEQEQEFLDKILTRIGQTDLDRAVKISRFLSSPHNTEEYYRSLDEKPEWAEIAADLQLRLNTAIEHYHMDMANVDEIYRGRNI